MSIITPSDHTNAAEETPITLDIPSTPEVPPRLSSDLPCKTCGYNLRTLLPNALCPECGTSVPESIAYEKLHRHHWLSLERFPIPNRILAILFGILLPWPPFLLMEDWGGGPGNFWAEWQSGDWQTYVGLLVGGVPSRPSYPFLLFAMAAMIAVITRPTIAGRLRVVRFGLLTGVIIGAQYTLILGGAMAQVEGIVIACVGLLFGLGVPVTLALIPRRNPVIPAPWHKRLWITIGIGLGLLLLACIAEATLGSGDHWWGLIIVWSLIGSPWLFMVAYAMALVRVARSGTLARRPTGAWIAWLIAWVSGYITSWVTSIALMLDEYARLPTSPPGCYICTASARGHRPIVNAWSVRLADGTSIRVTRQMQTLKAGELAILAVCPRMHRLLRRAYDWLGPKLAARLMRPLLADVAYLTMQPIALTTALLLHVLLPDASRRIRSLYQAPATS